MDLRTASFQAGGMGTQHPNEKAGNENSGLAEAEAQVISLGPEKSAILPCSPP